MEREPDGVPCYARYCRHNMLSKYHVAGCAYIKIELDESGRCKSYDDKKPNIKRCDTCDCEYEGNEPRNCQIYKATGKCKFIKKAVNTIINPCMVVRG